MPLTQYSLLPLFRIRAYHAQLPFFNPCSSLLLYRPILPLFPFSRSPSRTPFGLDRKELDHHFVKLPSTESRLESIMQTFLKRKEILSKMGSARHELSCRESEGKTHRISAILVPPLPMMHPISSLGTAISCDCWGAPDWGPPPPPDRSWLPASAARAAIKREVGWENKIINGLLFCESKDWNKYSPFLSFFI